MRVGLLLAVLLVAACASDEDARLSVWQERCAKYGFEAGSPDMARCVQTEEQEYREASPEARQEMLGE